MRPQSVPIPPVTSRAPQVTQSQLSSIITQSAQKAKQSTLKPKLGDPDWSNCVGGSFCGGLCDGNCCANTCGSSSNSCWGQCIQAVNATRDAFEFAGGEVGVAALAAACSLAGCDNL